MQRQRFFGRPKESINSSTATVDQRSLFLFLEPWELIFCLVSLLMSLDKRLGQDQKLPSERVSLSSTVLSILPLYWSTMYKTSFYCFLVTLGMCPEDNARSSLIEIKQCLKITEKSHSILRAKRAKFTF